MELRKCECGGNPELKDQDHFLFGVSWFVACNDCLRSTECVNLAHEAIQAWNEGKVE